MAATIHEDWMNRKWRPAMGWTYMFICILDFAVFPVLWSIIQATHSGTVSTQWDPITLRGAGLFHMAMGAILGIAAWSRGQEKIYGVSYGASQQVPIRISSRGKPMPIPQDQGEL
jgi:hypothetical protein